MHNEICTISSENIDGASNFDIEYSNNNVFDNVDHNDSFVHENGNLSDLSLNDDHTILNKFVQSHCNVDLKLTMTMFNTMLKVIVFSLEMV